MFQIPESKCPHCGRVYRCQTPAHLTGLPKPADVLVCYGCTKVLTFDQEMKLSELPLSRWYVMPLDQRLQIRDLQRTLLGRN